MFFYSSAVFSRPGWAGMNMLSQSVFQHRSLGASAALLAECCNGTLLLRRSESQLIKHKLGSSPTFGAPTHQLSGKTCLRLCRLSEALNLTHESTTAFLGGLVARYLLFNIAAKK